MVNNKKQIIRLSFLFINFLLRFSAISQSLLYDSKEVLYENSQNKDYALIKDNFKVLSQNQKELKIPEFSSLYLKFKIPKAYQSDTTLFIHFGKIGLVELFDLEGGKLKLLAKTGGQCPMGERSIASDKGTLRLTIDADFEKQYLLKIQNFTDNKALIKPKLYNYVGYNILLGEREKTAFLPIITPLFFGVIILVLFIALIQLYLMPDSVSIYYFLYVFCLFMRSVIGIEIFDLEKSLPFLTKIGILSGNSQFFTFTSFIFYILFIRAFTGFVKRQPKWDWSFKIQMVYLSIFILFDFMYPYQKYMNHNINIIFRTLEGIGAIWGLVSLFILFKVYDSLNKFIIWGACSLVLIAIVGQEILFRLFDIRRDTLDTSVVLIWTIAYVTEFAFFTIALVFRQKKLSQKLAAKELAYNNLQETINIISKREVKKLDGYESLAINNVKDTLLLPQNEIIRLEASGSYTIVHYLIHKTTVASHTIADFEPKLHPERFMRVHNSHIVNLGFIAKYTKGDGGILTLQDGTEVPVSRSRKQELITWLTTTS